MNIKSKQKRVHKKSFLRKAKDCIRKYLSCVIIPSIPFNGLRIVLYRRCGYNIGKNVFIGMHCYLDDLEPSKLKIEDDVVISYGVYFACHSPKQPRTSITIKKGAYLGMRTSVVSGKTGVIIGENAVIGACSLVLKNVPDFTTVGGIPARTIE